MALWLTTPSALWIGLLSLALYLTRRLLFPSPPAPLPPGPRGLPLIGNLLDWPKEKEWEVFAQWGQRYGDIIHCNLAGQRVVILNSAQEAFELLDKKGAIYSGRPFLYVACELAGWKKSPPLSPYGENLRTMRRMISRETGNKAAIARHTPMIASEVQKFLLRMLDAPASGLLYAHVRKMATAIILRTSHGYQVSEGDDLFVDLAERAMADAEEIFMPGRFLVDLLPFLDYLPRWFPGTGYRKRAALALANAQAFHDAPYEWAKQQVAQGAAHPSCVTSQLEGKALTAEEEDLVKYAAGTFYGAGSETTFCAIVAFFLAMTLHPDIQARARAEIDSVVGRDRLPSLADRDRLPYLNAVCQEVLRWAPPVPLGLPHVATEDDIHDGYLIPKGTVVMANIWQLTHDERVYRDPTLFDPARFHPEDGGPPEHDPREYVFGFGRRICPGAPLAYSTFFLACAMSLASLDIAKQVDANGVDIEPEVMFTSGMVVWPKPFPCSIRARTPKAEALVRDYTP